MKRELEREGEQRRHGGGREHLHDVEGAPAAAVGAAESGGDVDRAAEALHGVSVRWGARRRRILEVIHQLPTERLTRMRAPQVGIPYDALDQRDHLVRSMRVNHARRREWSAPRRRARPTGASWTSPGGAPWR